jgi:hypothetical protein
MLGGELGCELGETLVLGAALTLGAALNTELGAPLTLGAALGTELGTLLVDGALEGSARTVNESSWSRTGEKTPSSQVLNRRLLGSVITQFLLQHCMSLKHLFFRGNRLHSSAPSSLILIGPPSPSLVCVNMLSSFVSSCLVRAAATSFVVSIVRDSRRAFATLEMATSERIKRVVNDLIFLLLLLRFGLVWLLWSKYEMR